jgi:sulfate/thiosulfate transport system substrate-binding protein
MRALQLNQLRNYRLLNWGLLLNRLAVGGFMGFLLAYALWPWVFPPAQPTRTVIVYGFSILGEVMNEGIFPAFAARWEVETGEQVEFISAFASSGTVTNQMIMGVPAEVAILSLELDALRLVEAGVVPGPTWRDLPHAGVVNRTPFIIIVRPGNPLNIQDFADLTRPGVGVVHPDPLTSGGAQWALLAEYGSVLMTGGDLQQAFDQLLGIWKNVVAQAASARAVRTQFESGFGDALITYEQEVISDLLRGRAIGEIAYPVSTILSEHTVVLLEDNIPADDLPVVRAFLDYLWSDEAQRIFVAYGFRSVDESLNSLNPYFGEIVAPFTVAEMGGWVEAKKAIVDAIWKDKVLPELGQ